MRGVILLSPNAAKDGDKPVKMQSRQFIFIHFHTGGIFMAKAKLTLKQEADMLSAVNQIKELEAAGKQLKNGQEASGGNGRGQFYRAVYHGSQQPV